MKRRISCPPDEDDDVKNEERLAGMTLEQLKAEYDTRLKQLLIEGIKNLPERVDSQLSTTAHKIICAALGVEYGNWTNSSWEIKDNSALAKALGEHVLLQVKLAIPNFIESLIASDTQVKPIKSAYQRAYKEKLAQLTNESLWKYAEKNAEKRFSEIMEEVTGEKPEVVKSEGEDEDEDTADNGGAGPGDHADPAGP